MKTFGSTPQRISNARGKKRRMYPEVSEATLSGPTNAFGNL